MLRKAVILVKSVPRGPGGLEDELQAQQAHVRAQTQRGTEAWRGVQEGSQKYAIWTVQLEGEGQRTGCMWGSREDPSREWWAKDRPTQCVCVRCLLGLM